MRKEHKSYGMVRFSRVYSSHGRGLFGSKIKHSNFIKLEITEGYMKRDLNKDYFYAGKTLCEVEMSQAQFANLITSMNMGDDIPCTISYIDKEGYIEPAEYTSPMERNQKEMEALIEEEMSLCTTGIEEIVERLEQKTITLTERRELAKDVKEIARNITDKLPWLAKMYKEEMEEVNTEAVAEIEAHLIAIRDRIGNQALKEMVERIDVNEDTNLVE